MSTVAARRDREGSGASRPLVRPRRYQRRPAAHAPGRCAHAGLTTGRAGPQLGDRPECEHADHLGPCGTQRFGRCNLRELLFDRRDQGTQRRDGLISIADRQWELLVQAPGDWNTCSAGSPGVTLAARASDGRTPAILPMTLKGLRPTGTTTLLFCCDRDGGKRDPGSGDHRRFQLHATGHCAVTWLSRLRLPGSARRASPPLLPSLPTRAHIALLRID